MDKILPIDELDNITRIEFAVDDGIKIMMIIMKLISIILQLS